ncbi:acid protease [Amniculicola lignicola CBS 123094]|uniref:Acid protease n=1 Tax=Amniculicola lignicola CBS 123094 TaxID=1392246 RepID=A0A6A5WDD0_9PLEO|nr:acid protease [Amniculicola lignicola CBS 123094]
MYFLSALFLFTHASLGLAFPSKFSRQSASQNVENQPITIPLNSCTPDLQDAIHSGPIVVQGKTFKVLFDTGSQYLVLPGEGCSAQDGCFRSTKYNSIGMTRVSNKPFTLEYIAGPVETYQYMDTLKIGKLAMADTEVYSGVNATGFRVLGNSGIDGILGLSTQRSFEKSKSFIERLFPTHRLPSNEFCFALNTCRESKRNPSELTLGGRNISKYIGNMITLPLVDNHKGKWTVPLNSITVGNTTTSIDSYALIDTGAYESITSKAVLAPIVEVLGALPFLMLISGTSNVTGYAFPCRRAFSIHLPPISLDLASQPIFIPPSHFIKYVLTVRNVMRFNMSLPLTIMDDLYNPQGQDWCMLSFIAQEAQAGLSPNTLGIELLRNWYACFSEDVRGRRAVMLGRKIRPG